MEEAELKAGYWSTLNVPSTRGAAETSLAGGGFNRRKTGKNEMSWLFFSVLMKRQTHKSNHDKKKKNNAE